MNRIRNNWKKILSAFIALAAGIIVTLWMHGVDNSITNEDEVYIDAFLVDIERASGQDEYSKQIEFIKKVQNVVLTRAPINRGLPFNAPREPKDLYTAGYGLCFDRSRVIEKILRDNGFETRHIFVYSIRNSSSLSAFVTPGVPSHAITEVLTQKGWLVIDSNDRWISTDSSGEPQGIDALRRNIDNTVDITWQDVPPPIYSDVAPFTFVYGLYSRHGRFFPPYNLIPDINYAEFADNF